MTPRIALLFLLSVVLASVVASRTRAGTPGQVVEVRQLDVGYELGAGALKARVTLATGEALEFVAADVSEAQTILRLAELVATGRVAMTATVDGRSVRSLQCAVRRGAVSP